MNKFISIAIICLLFASKSFACQCIGPSANIEENWKGSYQVFVGEVLESSSDKLYLASGLNYTYYTIQVIESLKGNYHPKYRLRTFERISHGSCDYTFEVGKKYLIYAYSDNGNLSTNICSRTAPIEEVNKNEIEELRRLTKDYGEEKGAALIIEKSVAERELGVAQVKIKELNNATEELNNTKNWLLGIALALALLLVLSVFTSLRRKKDKVQHGS
ncbi:hypothetical protein [Pontibacter pudoricolor]|uniref:hypothetical protein n=1 Tax=Pontibacter pudoricolor TaxID=2694930 RepID=UPI001390B487|nr:hypothetical protein [Pontibacter pudoricolor]